MKSFISLFLLLMTAFVLVACDGVDDQLPVERHLVTFETNSDITLHPLEFSAGDSIDLPVLTTGDQGVFQGWYLDPDLTEAADALSDVTEDFTVYARWQEASYAMLVDVYHRLNVERVFMNDIASFYLDDAGKLYTQINTSNSLASELGWGATPAAEPFDVDEDVDTMMYSWGNSAYLVTSSGTVYSWGDNRYGQLGDGGDTSSLVFKDISEHFELEADESIIRMDGNAKSTFALTTHGHVYAWGSNEHNLISENENGVVLEPRDTINDFCGVTDHFLHDSGLCGDTENQIVDMAVMERHVVFLTSAGEVLVLGDDVSHWFDGVDIQGGNISEAVSAELRGQIIDIKASSHTVVFVSDNNQLLVLGDSMLAQEHHRLSIGDFHDPDDDGDSIPDLFGVHLAGDTLLVHLTDDTLWGVGDNQTQLVSGKKGYDYVQSSTQLTLSFTPTKLMTSSEGACAIDDDRSLWCWGQGNSRSVGSGDENVLHSTYRYVIHQGEDTDWQGTEEKPGDVDASYAFSSTPVNILNSPPVARQQQLYTVTRYHVSGVPETITYQGRLNAKSVVDNICGLNHNDCNDEDPTVYPGAYQVYERSDGLVRWMFEVGIERGRTQPSSVIDSGN